MLYPLSQQPSHVNTVVKRWQSSSMKLLAEQLFLRYIQQFWVFQQLWFGKTEHTYWKGLFMLPPFHRRIVSKADGAHAELVCRADTIEKTHPRIWSEMDVGSDPQPLWKKKIKMSLFKIFYNEMCSNTDQCKYSPTLKGNKMVDKSREGEAGISNGKARFNLRTIRGY